jgi:phosphate:Na+ symporter
MEYLGIVIKLCAGLVFFLFGMSTMSDSLEKMAGSKLEVVLKKMTDKPILGVVMGIVITAIIQSSSATTVILVGLVNSGLMKLVSAISVLLGANIGTTVTSWLLSLSGLSGDSVLVQVFKPQNFAPIFAIIGTAFVMTSKSEKKKVLGTMFIGFTVLIYGMDIMSDSVEGLADMPWFGDLLVKFNNPILGVLMGALITAIIQSSSASVGILQALSLTGAITFDMAVPIVIGQNIGTCVTGMISSIAAGAKAKRVAVSQLLINVSGMIIVLPLYLIGVKVIGISIGDDSVNPVSIAIIHTVFNMVTVLVLMPFVKYLAKLTEKLVKEKTEDIERKKKTVRLDDRLLQTPSIAVMECDSYTVKMALLAKETILEAMDLLRAFDKEKATVVYDNEGIFDEYEDGLGTYLVKMSSQSLSTADAQTVTRMLHAIGDFERLGDHALNLQKVAEEMNQKKIVFSEKAQKEIEILLKAITEIVITTTTVYEKDDIDLAKRVEPLEQVVDSLCADIKSRHVKRLKNGECTIELGFILSDLLTNCQRISDHCSNIAVATIESHTDNFDTHKYLNSVKYGNDEFKVVFEEYSNKYELAENN